MSTTPEATEIVVPETESKDYLSNDEEKPVESHNVCKCKTEHSEGKPALADPTAPEDSTPEPPVVDPSKYNEKAKGEDLGWLTAPRRFLVDSKYFLTKCTKPDGHGIRYDFPLTAELRMTFGAIWKGFLIMGCLAFIIRLAHIPLNQFLVSGHRAS
jgi:preprotein translocase subunit Sss1